MLWKMARGMVLITMVAAGAAQASRDHDGTVWMYEADGSDFAGNGSLPGNNETIDVDGTRINGWDYHTCCAGTGTTGWDVNDPDDRWNRDTFGFTASDPVMPMPGVITYDLNEDGSGGFARDQTLGSMNPGDVTPNTGFTYEWRMATHWAGNDRSEKIFIQVDTGVLFDRAFSFRLNWSDQPNLGFGTGQIVDVWGVKGIGAATNLIDPDGDGNAGPSVFHTYRLVLEAMGLDGADDPTEASADLYIDEVFVDTVFGRLFVDGGFPGSNIENPNDPRPGLEPGPGPRITFGRWSSSRYNGIQGASWDFVHIHPGATPPPAVMPCDFNSDSQCNDVDIDLLAAAVRNGTSDAKFNVDGVGGDIPDDADFNFYITDDSMLSTGFGDADLNLLVNFGDFVALSNNFGENGGWALGNFTLDEITNFVDFVSLSNNFGMNFASGSNVPEPAALALVAIGVLVITARRWPKCAVAVVERRV